MPAVSKAQQKFMGMVHGLQKGTVKPSKVSGKVKKVAKSMKKKSAKDFASTKHKGLPKKVKSESVNEVSFSSVPTKKLVKQYKQMADEKLSGSAALTFRMIAKELIKRKAKLESDVKEGFGGELKGKARQKFEKARQENAEVLGYKLTGTKDIKESIKKALHEDMDDTELAGRIKHWAGKHKGTGIGYGHVLGQLAVHMKEMGWSKSFKEVVKVAKELGKKKTVESVFAVKGKEDKDGYRHAENPDFKYRMQKGFKESVNEAKETGTIKKSGGLWWAVFDKRKKLRFEGNVNFMVKALKIVSGMSKREVIDLLKVTVGTMKGVPFKADFSKDKYVRTESVDEAKETGIDIAKRVVKNKQHEKGLDLTTANFIVKIYDAYKEHPNLQRQMDKMPLPKMVKLAYRVMK